MPNAATVRNLADLRREIDAIDAEIHAALMRRAAVIDAITAAKHGREGGAFRPDREADMMRMLAARHHGALPIVTIEHVWRELISTFTQLQSPYRLHVAPGDEALKIADMARFYFGFSTPVASHASPSAVVEAVAGSRNDLGLVLLEPAASEPWWLGLGTEAAVMARLPFLRLPAREAGTPALVLSRPLPDCRPFDRVVLAVAGDGAWSDAECLAAAAGHALIAAPAAARGAFPQAREAGGYFAPIDWRGPGD